MIEIDAPAAFLRSFDERLQVEALGIVERKFIRLIHGLPRAPIVAHSAACARCKNSGFWYETSTGTQKRVVICACGSWYDRAEMSGAK